MDGIRATPMQYPILGLLADRLKRAQQFAVAPGGYANPPAEVLLNLLGVPAIQQTMERVAYGEPLTTGRGMTTRVRPEVAEAAMTLLPVAGTARVAERGAMAAGRAGERMAERMVPQIMERGGMPAGLLEGMSSRTVSPLTVYHGSPAKFERFDPTKIGSGEGAQAYGYGHYVAQNPAVAKEYRTVLSEPELFVKGRQIKTAAGSNMDTAKAWLQDSFEMGAKNPYADAIEKVSNAPLKDKQGVIDALRKLENRGVQMQKGGFEYEIDLPDEQIARMLDWDKPLSQLPQKIQQAIYNDLTDAGYGKEIVNDLLNRKTGMELYKTLYKGMEQGDEAAINLAKKLNLGEQGMMMEAPALASESLRRMGIPGIRYLDQSSRGINQTWVVNNPKFGSYDFPSLEEAQAFIKSNPQYELELIEPQKTTSNFVVFPGNEDLLTILKRNGGLLGP